MLASREMTLTNVCRYKTNTKTSIIRWYVGVYLRFGAPQRICIERREFENYYHMFWNLLNQVQRLII